MVESEDAVSKRFFKEKQNTASFLKSFLWGVSGFAFSFCGSGFFYLKDFTFEPAFLPCLGASLSLNGYEIPLSPLWTSMVFLVFSTFRVDLVSVRKQNESVIKNWIRINKGKRKETSFCA